MPPAKRWASRRHDTDGGGAPGRDEHGHSGLVQPSGKVVKRTYSIVTLVLATDTGITAALGLVQGAGFQALATEAIVIWLRTTPDDFLPETLVRERMPPACRELCIAATPPIGDPERLAQARAILHQVLGRVVIRQAFACGDGAVNYALLDDLVAAGVPATKDHDLLERLPQ